ncbi:MAG TPA: hypothetical protein VL426_01355 [Candidatus Binatia bacterium]|nr:hypothetical protein [Candidatus Binatia bacterium]
MDATSKGPVPAAKWADRIRIFSGSPAQAVEMTPEELAQPLPDPYRVIDLEKTDEESAAIGEIVAAVNDLRRLFCGYGPLAIAEERVHILSEEEFHAKIAPSRFQGKSRFGHVYLWRGWPLSDLMALLAHELMHDVSYLWIDFWAPGAVSADGVRWPPFVERRQGMVLIDPSYGTWLPHFHGLNECVTETSAVLVRKMAAGRTRLLDAAGRERLAKFVTSEPLLAFTDALIAASAGPGGDTVAAWTALFRDNLAGTGEFLRLLDARLPGATEVLRATGARPTELLPAAEKLGLESAATLIRLYCR